MKTCLVCVSAAAVTDRRIPLLVNERVGLARVSQMAIDDFSAFAGEAITDPLFVDIHPAEPFGGVSWRDPRASSCC